jgi:hypothetical protein
VDEGASSSGHPLEGDWVGFPNADPLEAGAQRDVRQRTTGLHNARLHYTKQQDVGQHILEPTTKPTAMKMSKGQRRNVTL